MSGTVEPPSAEDVATIMWAFHLEESFAAGIFPRGGAQTSHFRKLVRFNMLEDTGELGRDIDGNVERDVPIYRLTGTGREWARARKASAL